MKTKIYLFILTLLLSVGQAWAAATTIAGGTISGTQITWKLDVENNELYLKLDGSGALPNTMTTPPWADCTASAVLNGETITKDHQDYRPTIKWLIIGSGITSVNNTVLGGLTNLLTIKIVNGSNATNESNYCIVENGALYQYNLAVQGSTPTRKLIIYPAKKVSSEFIIPSDVTSIEVNAFNENKNIKSLYIKGDISSIGAGAFNNCSNLSLIHFNKDYEGSYSWSGMAATGKLITASRSSIGHQIGQTIKISAPSGWEERSHYKTELLDKGYASLHNGNLYIYGPQGTTYKVSTFNESEADNYIWNSAKSEITSLTIGKGITGIDEAALSGGNYTSLTTITVEDGNTNFFVIDDNKVLLNNDKTKLILYAQGNAATKYTVPGTISVIGEGAFMGAQNLTEVEMTSIGTLSKNAFNGCSNLSRIRVFNSVAAPYIGVDALKNLAWKGVLTYRGNHNSFDTMLATINTRNAGNEATAQWTRGYYYICNNGNTATLEDGVLTVSGNQPLTSNEWANEKNLITTVVIGEEIPSVGNNAFENYVALKNLYLYGGGVIGSEAFKNCTALQKITIGSNVSSFHNYKTPSGIVYTSFDGCGNIQTIDINDIAVWCKIQNKDQLFNADKASGYTLMLNGEVFDGTTHLVIPEAVTTVGSSFKYFSNVKYIELPKNKERLENYEFEDYKYLRYLYLPKNLKTIGAEACRGCSSLIALTIPASVETISDGAFSGCSSITQLFLNGGREIKEHAFKGCSALKEITISSKVKSFFTYTSGFYDTFEGCDNIETIDIENITDWCNLQNKEQLFKANKPEGYTLKIKGDAESVWSIEIPSSITNVGSSFKYFNNVQKIILSEGRVSVANGEFRDYKYLKNLILPSSLKTIGMSACNGCSSLRTVEIPSSVENIQRGAFSGCSSLQSLYLLGGGTIEPEAFKNCTELSEITIGSKVKSFYYPGAIQQATFEGCNNIHTIDVLDLEAWCKIEKKDQLFHYNGHDYYLMYQSKELADNNTRLNIPADITYVGSSFKYFKNVEYITLDGRVSIADNEFSGYTYLKMLTLDIGLKVIGSNAFLGCTSLQRITIPQTVDIIKNSAFRGCTSMNELSLQGGGTIGQEAFGGCTALKKVIIDYVSSLYFDGYLAHSPFNQCDNIEEVHVRDLLLYCKIKNIRALTEVGKTGKLLYMGSPVGETTTTINVPGGVTDIEYHAFYNYGNTDLTEVILPPTVATIGNLAFYGAPNINVVRSYATDVPTVDSPLITNPGSATLYVPTGTRSAYAAHPIWKDFGTIEEFDTPQLNKYRINAPIGTSTHELTMEGTTIKQVDSSDKTIAWWQDGMVYTRGSYYTGQGKYVEKEAVLTVTGDNGAVSYCVVNVAPKAQLTDGQAYTNPEDVEMESVVYTRNFGASSVNKWQALCIPFSIDVVSDDYQIAEIFAFCPTKDTNGDGIVNGQDEDNLIVTPCTSGMTVPNVPYMIKPKKSGDIIFTAGNCTLYAANEGELNFSTTRKEYTIHGLLQNSVDATVDNQYYYMSASGNLNIRTQGSATVKTNRWYMTMANKSYGGGVVDDDSEANRAVIRVIAIGEDIDEETAIRLIEGDAIGTTSNTTDNAIYTINGIKVSDANNLPAGIYIKNGKKFMIK